MTSFRKLSWFAVILVCAFTLAGAQDYLPLSVGTKWVLRNPQHPERPVTFEVTQRVGDGFRIRSTTPFGASEWTLENHGGKYYMTEYGNGNGQVMQIPSGTLYFDLGSPAGTRWSNKLGKLSVTSTAMAVTSSSGRFERCIQIKHDFGGGASVFTFAPGIGFVQFGEGRDAFVLDEGASDLPGRTRNSSASSRPYDSDRDRSNDRHEAEDRRPPSDIHLGGSGRPVIGLTANQLATDPGPQSMVERFDQVRNIGAKYLVANGNWRELEPKEHRYALDSLNYLVSVARPAHMQISYTLRIIDTVDRNVPGDLKNTKWADRKLQDRLFGLLDAMAPALNGNVQWFMIGYESNEYFNRHPNEIGDFIELYRQAKSHLQQRVPGIKVSTTLMFSGLGDLDTRFSNLNRDLDVLALTYMPLNSDFSVQDPSVIPRDFARIKEFANGRKIVFQEIGYPSSPVVGSSEEKQAQFYRLAFEEINRDPSAFSAINWMTLGDLSDNTTRQFSQYYGLKGADKFEADLQTMGVFDKRGQPKKSWDVFREQMKGF